MRERVTVLLEKRPGSRSPYEKCRECLKRSRHSLHLQRNERPHRSSGILPVEVNRFTVKETIHKALSIADTQKYARYSQKNIDTILSNQAEAVITVDQDNEITFFNKSAEKLFAVSGADVIGRKSWNIFPQNTFEAVLKGGEPQETHPHTVHGVDIVGNYRPVFDNGSVIGAVGTFSTMTDIQKKDEFIRGRDPFLKHHRPALPNLHSNKKSGEIASRPIGNNPFWGAASVWPAHSLYAHGVIAT